MSTEKKTTTERAFKMRCASGRSFADTAAQKHETVHLFGRSQLLSLGLHDCRLAHHAVVLLYSPDERSAVSMNTFRDVFADCIVTYVTLG